MDGYERVGEVTLKGEAAVRGRRSFEFNSALAE